MVFSFTKKDRALGVANSCRAYDIALQNDPGRRFLLLLMALMVALAVMSVAGYFALQGLASSWVNGLENKITIEISALGAGGELRDIKAQESIAAQISARLEKDNNILDIETMDTDDVAALLSPWLKDTAADADLPLPILMSLSLRHSAPEDLDALKASLGPLAREVRIDTHDEWLGDILALARLIQFAALAVTALVGTITFAAIAAAIHARIQVHKDEVELLHLIGARDEYIIRQFERYITGLSLRGCLAGFTCGAIFIALANWLSVRSLEGMDAAPGLSQSAWFCLALIPIVTALIAVITARMTVKSALRRMP